MKQSIGEYIVEILKLLIGFILAILIIGIFGLAGQELWKAIKGGGDLSTAILGATVTVLTITLQKWLEYDSKKKQIIRDKRLPIYNKILECFISVCYIKDQKEINKKIDELRSSTHEILSWSSDEFIKEYGYFRNSANEYEKNKDIKKFLIQFEKLIFQIRKDLGYKNYNLKKGDLLKCFINDLKKQ